MIPSDFPANLGNTHHHMDSLANPGNVHLHIESDSPVNLRKPHHHHMDSLVNLGISLKVHLYIAFDLGTRA
jgi:hypothetical protein